MANGVKTPNAKSQAAIHTDNNPDMTLLKNGQAGIQDRVEDAG
jgi:hypothetical protein